MIAAEHHPGRARTARRKIMEPESVAKQLWRKASAGDGAAYEQLFALHADHLLVFIRARMGEALRAKVEPEDVLQDAYLAAHRCFAEFEYRDEGAFLRWVCRIISNRLRDAADHFGALKRQDIEVPRSWPTGPQTAAGRAEGRQQIEQALQQLSPEHREVILLRYFEGLSAEEIGRQMNRTSGAARNLLSRALVELGKQMKSQQQDSWR